MRYRYLGGTGLRVSLLSLGTTPFGGKMGAVSGVDQATASRIVGKAIDAGINLFDTADEYSQGESEEMLAQALGGKKDDVLIATKAGYRTGERLNDVGSSRSHLALALEGSLRRLGRDHVDIFYVHVFDPHTSVYELLGTLDAFVTSGKARVIGASNYPAWRLVEALLTASAAGLPRFNVYQGLWNILVRDAEVEIAPACLESNLGFVAWAPLAGGWLTGKYRRDLPWPTSGRLADPGDDILRIDRRRGVGVVEVLAEIAQHHACTVSQVALSWQFTRPWLSSSTIGVRTEAQLEENLGSLSVELSSEDLARIDEAAPAPRVWPHWFLEDFAEE